MSRVQQVISELMLQLIITDLDYEETLISVKLLCCTMNVDCLFICFPV